MTRQTSNQFWIFGVAQVIQGKSMSLALLCQHYANANATLSLIYISGNMGNFAFPTWCIATFENPTQTGSFVFLLCCPRWQSQVGLAAKVRRKVAGIFANVNAALESRDKNAFVLWRNSVWVTWYDDSSHLILGVKKVYQICSQFWGEIVTSQYQITIVRYSAIITRGVRNILILVFA